MEKLNNIKEGTHKRNPIKMGSLTSKQLKELLHPTDCFTKSDKYPDTTTFKEALVKHLKKGLSLGITNDELNTKLISFVGQAIEDQQKAYKITLEKNQPNKEHILNYHSKEIKFLEDQLKEIKENPIDFTVFLDDQA